MNLVSFSPTFKLNICSTNVGIRVRFDTMQNGVNQRKTIFQGGDIWNTRLLHLLLHQRRSWTALFCVFGENKKSRFSLKIRILRCFAFLCCGATRNRNLFPNSWISLLSKSNSTVISSVCSTSDLRCSAQGCVKVSKGKGSELVWTIVILVL